MMKNKIFVMFVISVLAVSLIAPFALAQESAVLNGSADLSSVEIADAGVGPDSIFYGLDKAFDRISLALTSGKTKKAEKALKIAEERLAEVKAMVEANKLAEAEEAEAEHDELVSEAGNLVEELESDGNQETVEGSLEDVIKVQDRIEEHRDKVAFVKGRILLRHSDKLTEEQLARLEEVFGRILNSTSDFEIKIVQKKDRIKVKYKVLTDKTDKEVDEFEDELENETDFSEHRMLRAEREVHRAESALDLLEARLSENDISEFDSEINDLREKLSEAEQAFEAGEYRKAKKIAHDVREFGEHIASRAKKLRKAREEGRFEEALGDLREETKKRRAKALRKIDKHLTEDEKDDEVELEHEDKAEASEHEEKDSGRDSDDDSEDLKEDTSKDLEVKIDSDNSDNSGSSDKTE